MIYWAGLVAHTGDVASLHANYPYTFPFIVPVAISHTDSAVQSSSRLISHSVYMLCQLLSLLVKFISYWIKSFPNIFPLSLNTDRLWGLVVRVLGYRSRDPELDSRRYQIFWEVVRLKRDPLSVVRITEELLEWKSIGSKSIKPRLTTLGVHCSDHATPSMHKSWH
jgi:hypothetical protein